MQKNPKYILDANIFINALNDTETTLESVECVMQDIFQENLAILVPDIAFYEVIYNLKKQNPLINTIEQAIDELLEHANVNVYHLDTKEYSQVLELAYDYNITTYDAAYLYLSFITDIPIMTLDKKFYNAIKAHYQNITII